MRKYKVMAVHRYRGEAGETKKRRGMEKRNGEEERRGGRDEERGIIFTCRHGAVRLSVYHHNRPQLGPRHLQQKHSLQHLLQVAW